MNSLTPEQVKQVLDVLTNKVAEGKPVADELIRQYVVYHAVCAAGCAMVLLFCIWLLRSALKHKHTGWCGNPDVDEVLQLVAVIASVFFGIIALFALFSEIGCIIAPHLMILQSLIGK